MVVLILGTPQNGNNPPISGNPLVRVGCIQTRSRSEGPRICGLDACMSVPFLAYLNFKQPSFRVRGLGFKVQSLGNHWRTFGCLGIEGSYQACLVQRGSSLGSTGNLRGELYTIPLNLDRRWLWVYYNKIPIYPIIYLF